MRRFSFNEKRGGTFDGALIGIEIALVSPATQIADLPIFSGDGGGDDFCNGVSRGGGDRSIFNNDDIFIGIFFTSMIETPRDAIRLESITQGESGSFLKSGGRTNAYNINEKERMKK